MAKFQVIVGNIGTVLDGDNEVDARETFDEYVKQSVEGDGRAAGEPVTLMEDGEPTDEYIPDVDPKAAPLPVVTESDEMKTFTIVGYYEHDRQRHCGHGRGVTWVDAVQRYVKDIANAGDFILAEVLAGEHEGLTEGAYAEYAADYVYDEDDDDTEEDPF